MRMFSTLSNDRINWYDSYVSYAVANGIIEKDYASYTAAQMNAAITRAEFVHIFHGAESTYKAINQVADNAIPDVNTGDAFASDIYEFRREGHVPSGKAASSAARFLQFWFACLTQRPGRALPSNTSKSHPAKNGMALLS